MEWDSVSPLKLAAHVATQVFYVKTMYNVIQGTHTDYTLARARASVLTQISPVYKQKRTPIFVYVSAILTHISPLFDVWRHR